MVEYNRCSGRVVVVSKVAVGCNVAVCHLAIWHWVAVNALYTVHIHKQLPCMMADYGTSVLHLHIEHPGLAWCKQSQHSNSPICMCQHNLQF